MLDWVLMMYVKLFLSMYVSNQSKYVLFLGLFYLFL